jgi:subtilisin family serine protease
VAVVARVTDVTAWESISEVSIGSTLGKAQDETVLVTARIPVARIEAVRAQPCVKSLKASQPLRRSLAATTLEMGTRKADYPAQTKPDGGVGVVVGIVDYGCDFAHENFRNADGSTRLLAIWDQYASGSSGPFGYGKAYTTADINAALKKANPYAALGYGPPVEEVDGTHGTHVMDIAAGNGRGTNTPGNAPKADLIFVEISTTDIEQTVGDVARQSFGDSVQMLEAVKFIFDQAGDRPCVVNVSLGTNGGPHDGTTLVEQGLDALIHAKPNRAVVIAASNSYADGIHAAGSVAPGGSTDLVWRTDLGRWGRELEVWLDGKTQLAVELIAPDGTSLGVAEPASNLTLADGNQLAIFVSNRLSEPNNGDNSISIYVAAGVPGGDWLVRLHHRVGPAADFHAWIEREDREQSSFGGTLDNSHTIGSISCGREVIAVGSFDAHKSAMPLSWFSSAGPTRDGRSKPEVSAPGHEVVAARSRSKTGTTKMSGTSMAAPAVTGLVALILAESKRKGVLLNSAQIRDAVIQTARRNPPPTAKGVWDSRYGYGRAHSSAIAQVAGGAAPFLAASGASSKTTGAAGKTAKGAKT